MPFRLGPAQSQAGRIIADHPLTVILKARRLGLTWLVLGDALWEKLSRPPP